MNLSGPNEPVKWSKAEIRVWKRMSKKDRRLHIAGAILVGSLQCLLFSAFIIGLCFLGNKQ